MNVPECCKKCLTPSGFMNVMDIELTAQQQNAVDDDSALVLVLGGPGTGRTTSTLR